MHDIIFVGLDVHRATVSVAGAEASPGGEVRDVGAVADRPDHVGNLVKRLAKSGRRLKRVGRAADGARGIQKSSADAVLVSDNMGNRTGTKGFAYNPQLHLGAPPPASPSPRRNLDSVPENAPTRLV